jgi:hypothetical protein
MKNYLTIFLIILISSHLFPQPEEPGEHFSGWMNQTIQRGTRNLNCRIYYPAFSEGSNAEADTLNGPYPVIAFGHGFFMQTSYYISLFKHLSGHGFIVIAPQFPDVQHSELADDLIYCLDFIRSQNMNSSSRFYNLADTLRTGVSGHSMGGGASLLAASRDDRILVAAPLAAAETTPSAIAVMEYIKGTIYLLAGEKDGITPPQTHQIPMYNNGLPLKALLSIKEGNHTKFLDVSTFDWTDPNGNISRQLQLLITRRYLTSVFRLILKEDPYYWIYAFGDSVNSDERVVLSSVTRKLIPLKFNLISPDELIDSLPTVFLWERTLALDPGQEVTYDLIVSAWNDFRDTTFIVKDLPDTIFSNTAGFEENITFYWRVKAKTSDTTYRYSEDIFTFTIVITGLKQDYQQIGFLLHQNYPNPFNPITTILYEIPLQERVIIKIYNNLGKELSTIVNEEKPAGSYKTEFSSEGLSSGIYFYSLTAGYFSETRKMIILK